MTSTQLGCDPGQMLVVHRTLRRGFAELPAMIVSVSDGDVPRARRVEAHAGDLLDCVCAHHTAQDESIWPKLTARVDLDAGRLTRLAEQREELADVMDEMWSRLPDWASRADPVKSERLAALMEQLHALLREHLDEETGYVLPLVGEHLSEREWQGARRRAMSEFPSRRLPVLLGYLLEDASGPEQSAVLATVPMTARLAYRLGGQRRYRREAAELRTA